MTLYVPEIGDRMQLTHDWTFNLHHEYRNQGLFDGLSKTMDQQYFRNRPEPSIVTLPKGTVLKLDRIYVRKGAKAFSSLSFYIDDAADENIKKKRFWAKLSDCNRIQFKEPTKLAPRTVSIHWGYCPNTVPGTGIQPPHYHNFFHRKNASIFAYEDQYLYNNDGRTPLFEAKLVREHRPATQEEIDKWYDAWYGKKGWFERRPAKPKEAVFYTYSKYHLIYSATGETIGKYTSIESMKGRARTYMNKILKAENEKNLFNS